MHHQIVNLEASPKPIIWQNSLSNSLYNNVNKFPAANKQIYYNQKHYLFYIAKIKINIQIY